LLFLPSLEFSSSMSDRFTEIVSLEFSTTKDEAALEFSSSIGAGAEAAFSLEFSDHPAALPTQASACAAYEIGREGELDGASSIATVIAAGAGISTGTTRLLIIGGLIGGVAEGTAEGTDVAVGTEPVANGGDMLKEISLSAVIEEGVPAAAVSRILFVIMLSNFCILSAGRRSAIVQLRGDNN
jgi:hypothetical protein